MSSSPGNGPLQPLEELVAVHPPSSPSKAVETPRFAYRAKSYSQLRRRRHPTLFLPLIATALLLAFLVVTRYRCGFSNIQSLASDAGSARRSLAGIEEGGDKGDGAGRTAAEPCAVIEKILEPADAGQLEHAVGSPPVAGGSKEDADKPRKRTKKSKHCEEAEELPRRQGKRPAAADDTEEEGKPLKRKKKSKKPTKADDLPIQQQAKRPQTVPLESSQAVVSSPGKASPGPLPAQQRQSPVLMVEEEPPPTAPSDTAYPAFAADEDLQDGLDLFGEPTGPAASSSNEGALELSDLLGDSDVMDSLLVQDDSLLSNWFLDFFQDSTSMPPPPPDASGLMDSPPTQGEPDLPEELVELLEELQQAVSTDFSDSTASSIPSHDPRPPGLVHASQGPREADREQEDQPQTSTGISDSEAFWPRSHDTPFPGLAHTFQENSSTERPTPPEEEVGRPSAALLCHLPRLLYYN